MGQALEKEEFTPEERTRFSVRLEESLEALERVLARPGFGVGPRTLGAELEAHFVDRGGRALNVCGEVLARARHRQLTVELGRFNVEINAEVVSLAGRPFREFGEDLTRMLTRLRRAASEFGGRVVLVGMLPTLRLEELGPSVLSPFPRYRVLQHGLRSHRERPFWFHIEGEETLSFEMEYVSPASACTSMQYHLKVDPVDFARAYNAAQLAIAPVLALCGNSPLFLGRRLWHETRIALYRQATDGRSIEEESMELPSRAGFGHGWVRQGAHELFAQGVALHSPLLPVVGHESPLEVVERGGVPSLSELRIHQGTVYPWNRAVYDPSGGGHVRVEMRALPSGPSVPDLLANGAFLLGLTLSLMEEVEVLVARMPFRCARTNFYRAAREGLDAPLFWPGRPGQPLAVQPARELLPHLLTRARRGLVAAGVVPDDVDPLFELLEGRLRTGRTGARWQLDTLARLEVERSRYEAITAMFERYLAHSEEGTPVHTWPDA
ncbi:glutamate-cysteine ligase family protein [Cystobacter ferrugineus]|uniref:Glutamate--cysteine ligase n=1 Tax=Cystobacter ferrugineus TaxID=83449 RepID=A0A1L9BBT4_9BACT|nr:glutamate-cysteine ligase family protein [Cystobacter ferrugineus]OJH39724.1 glutamate--cysteine ligase [Cystobacter ferrugineus]